MINLQLYDLHDRQVQVVWAEIAGCLHYFASKMNLTLRITGSKKTHVQRYNRFVTLIAFKSMRFQHESPGRLSIFMFYFFFKTRFNSLQWSGLREGRYNDETSLLFRNVLRHIDALACPGSRDGASGAATFPHNGRGPMFLGPKRYIFSNYFSRFACDLFSTKL